MNNKFASLKDFLDYTLGFGELTDWSSSPIYSVFKNEIFVCNVYIFDEKTPDRYQLFIDRVECFNKNSQCPIQLTWELNKQLSFRKMNRLMQALDALQTHEEPGTLFGRLQGFDEFAATF